MLGKLVLRGLREKNSSMSIGFEIDTDIIVFRRVMKVLYTSRNTFDWQPLQ